VSEKTVWTYDTFIGDAWTDYAGVYSVYAVNFRYVKITLDFTTADSGVMTINASTVRLDVKQKTFEGVAAAVSTDVGGTTVYLTDDGLVGGNKVFLDVTSIVATAKGNFAHVHPTAQTVTAGTVITGSYASLTADDSTYFQIQEVAATPGFDVGIDIAAAASNTTVVVKGRYQGSVGHTVYIQSYNNNTLAWDNIVQMVHATSDQTYTFATSPSYVSSGLLKLRFYHTSAGDATHNLYLQFLEVMNLTVDTALYDFVDAANPLSFSLYRFDSSGVRVSGSISYVVRGV